MDGNQQDKLNTLAGKVAVITGAGRGIGRAIAVRLAGSGAKTALLSRSSEPLEETARAVQEAGGECINLVVDVTNRADVATAVQAVADRWGRIDILINNAGVGHYVPFDQLTEEQMDEMFAVNVKGTLFCCQEALPHLLAVGGHVVNLASVRGLEVAPTSAGYSATKFGTIALSHGLEQEYGSKGLRVTALCPGGVRSDFAGQSAADKPAFWLTPDDVAEMTYWAVSAPRHMRVERIVAWPQEIPET